MRLSLQLGVLTLFVLGVSHVFSLKQKEDESIIDPEMKGKIDDFIKNVFLPNAGVNALGLSIVQTDGEGNRVLLYTNGNGMANHERGIPNSNRTQFLIASITKTLTATVVVKVLSEKFPELGEAVLDTPIRKLIPSANFTMIDRFRSEHGTFRDLLSHRMCFKSNTLLMGSESFDSTEEVFYRERYAEEVCTVRNHFEYSNDMYLMAGELIGILANRSYGNLVQDLLTDFGMTESALTKKTDDFPSMSFRAQPYYFMNNVRHLMNTDLIKRVVDFNAVGGLFSTANDMAKYMDFRLSLGKVAGKQIIPEHVMKWLSTPSMAFQVNFFKTSEEDIVMNYLAYGVGIMLQSYDGWQLQQHGGSWSPYQSLFSLFPSQNLGVFTTTNEGPLLANQFIIHAFIFEILRDSDKASERISRLMEQEKVKQAEIKDGQNKSLQNFLTDKQNTRGVDSTRNVIGKYGSGSSGEVEILEKFNPETNTTGLYVSYGKWACGWLESYSSDDDGDDEITNFRVYWDTDIIQDFYANGDPGLLYARVTDDTFEFLAPGQGEMQSFGKFRLGVSLDKLPPIPWDPESC